MVRTRLCRPTGTPLPVDLHLPENAQRIGLRRRARAASTVTVLNLTDEEEARRAPAEDFGIDAPKGLTLLR
jgi:N-hydroxyarylamine O-acetyltransferase